VANDSPKVLIIGTGFIGKNILKVTDNVEHCSHINAIELLQKSNYDIVLNTAFDPKGYSDLIDVRESFDVKLLAALKNSDCFYAYLSSQRVYSDQALYGATEESPCEPSSSYGLNKLAIERLIYSTLPSQRVILLRLPNIFGNEINESRNSFFKIFLTNLLKTQTVQLDFDPNIEKDFLFIDDFGILLKRFIQKATSGIYNVSYGTPVKCTELITSARSYFPNLKVSIDIKKHHDKFYLNSSRLNSLVSFDGLLGFENAINKVLFELSE
jgi:nucleoside-diphosphate-sugar epimerase